MSTYPFQVHDLVNYRNSGVCEISEIRMEDLGMGKKAYYILRSIKDNGTTIKIPVDSPAVATNMHHVLSREEIDAAIMDAEEMERRWITDYKERSAEFEAILLRGERKEILTMIKTLAFYRENCLKSNRKFGTTDARLLERAESAIKQEFAYSLNIPEDEVIPYIIRKATGA